MDFLPFGQQEPLYPLIAGQHKVVKKDEEDAVAHIWPLGPSLDIGTLLNHKILGLMRIGLQQGLENGGLTRMGTHQVLKRY